MSLHPFPPPCPSATVDSTSMSLDPARGSLCPPCPESPGGRSCHHPCHPELKARHPGPTRRPSRRLELPYPTAQDATNLSRLFCYRSLVQRFASRFQTASQERRCDCCLLAIVHRNWVSSIKSRKACAAAFTSEFGTTNAPIWARSRLHPASDVTRGSPAAMASSLAIENPSS